MSQDLNLPCPPLIYPSKRDGWVVCCLVLLTSLFIILGIKTFEAHPPVVWLSPVLFLLAAVTLWPLYGIWYAIFPDRLLIHSVGFSRQIPLDQIERVISMRTGGLAPALSLDRLCITYTRDGMRKELQISPIERGRFLRELQVVAPWIEIDSTVG